MFKKKSGLNLALCFGGINPRLLDYNNPVRLKYAFLSLNP